MRAHRPGMPALLLLLPLLVAAACVPEPPPVDTSPTPGPFPGGYPPPVTGIPYTRGVDTFQDLAVLADGSGAYALHPSGILYRGGILESFWSSDPAPTTTNPSDVIDVGHRGRGVTVSENGTGYVLDGYGGLHPFGFNHGARAPDAIGEPSWPGWDIARGVALFSDGSGGYVLDGWGGLHAFRTPGHPMPPPARGGPYWKGWSIAQGVALLPDGTGGYVLDGWGGVHGFRVGDNPMPPVSSGSPYWPNWNIARGIGVHPDGGAYTLDGFGGIHPFRSGWEPEPAAPGTYTNPVYPKNSADPSVVVDSYGGYHAFSTGRQFTGNYPHYSSADLAEFSYTQDAMPDMPAWAGGYPVAWAPDVELFGSTWVMYFTARHYASGRQCIGVAQSPTIDGPYDADEGGPLVCTGSAGGSGGAIDASVFVDDDGSAYLLWKNDGNCCGAQTAIWIRPLAPDGLSLSGKTTRLVVRDQAWENGNANTAPNEPYKTLIEAPVMVRNGGGQYHLLYSGNWWASPYYAIGRARCISPTGPCLKTTLNPIVGSDGPVAGPGGPDVFVDRSGQGWLAYHGWTASRVTTADGGKRSLRLDRLTFPNDTPTTDAPTAWPRPLIGPSGAAQSNSVSGGAASPPQSAGAAGVSAAPCTAPSAGVQPRTGPTGTTPPVPGSAAVDTRGLVASDVASHADTSWVVLREFSNAPASDSVQPPPVTWLGRVEDPARGIRSLVPVVANCEVTAMTADAEGVWLATCAVSAPIGSRSGAEILRVGNAGAVDARIAVPTRCVDSLDVAQDDVAAGWSGLIDEPAGVWTVNPATGTAEGVDAVRDGATLGGVVVSGDDVVVGELTEDDDAVVQADPATGATRSLGSETADAIPIGIVDDGLWLRRDDPAALVRVAVDSDGGPTGGDESHPVTAEIPAPGLLDATVGESGVWYQTAVPTESTIRVIRLDPATGERLDSFDYEGGQPGRSGLPPGADIVADDDGVWFLFFGGLAHLRAS